MIASYANAHKRINNALELFVGGCAVVLAAAAIQGHPRLPLVCLLSGLIGHAIEVWPKPSSFARRADLLDLERESAGDDGAFEPAEESAFYRKFLQFCFLLGTTAFLMAYVVGGAFWINCIAGVMTWFTSMLSLLFLCAPRDTESKL